MLEEEASFPRGEVTPCDGLDGQTLLLPLHVHAHRSTPRHRVKEDVAGVGDVELDAALGVRAGEQWLAMLSFAEANGLRRARQCVTQDRAQEAPGHDEGVAGVLDLEAGRARALILTEQVAQRRVL